MLVCDNKQNKITLIAVIINNLKQNIKNYDLLAKKFFFSSVNLQILMRMNTVKLLDN